MNVCETRKRIVDSIVLIVVMKINGVECHIKL